jgi:SAM-dependent methyltransferase
VTYSDAFYEEETRVALESARIVLPLVLRDDDEWVIDVGCGTGGWAKAAHELGRHVVGVDWEVPEALRLIETFLNKDLVGGYRCDGYDLAICLEVAEHLPEESAEPLVAGLAKAGRVLFSAATPGQPGVDHIHCQPHEYWHDLFAQHGMTPDHVGPTWPEEVADFYRRNAFIYERNQ